MFSEGNGAIAYDTSGIDPAADLTLTGHYQYDGSWGVIFLAGGGKAQATVQASSKLNTLIQATRRILDRGLGHSCGRGHESVGHRQLFGRRHLAQLHAGADQPGL